MGFSESSVDKESACNVGNPGSIPGSGRPAREGIGYPLQDSWASLMAQLVKNLPAKQETWVWSLGWEDPLEKERLRIPVFWPGEFHGLYSLWGHKESDMTERLSLSLFNSDTDHVVSVNVGRLDLEKTYCRQQKWIRTCTHCPRLLSQASSACSWPLTEHSGNITADSFPLTQQPPGASYVWGLTRLLLRCPQSSVCRGPSYSHFSSHSPCAGVTPAPEQKAVLASSLLFDPSPLN